MPEPIWKQEKFADEKKYQEKYVELVKDLRDESRQASRTIRQIWKQCEEQVEDAKNKGPASVTRSDIEIVPHSLEEAVAMLVEHLPRPQATAPEPALEQFAAGLNKAMDQELTANDFDIEPMPDVAYDMKLFNLGVLKITWDQTLAGCFGNEGRNVIKSIDPRNCNFDPYCRNMYDQRYFIVEEVMDLSEVRRRYPDKVVELESEYSLSRIESGKNLTNGLEVSPLNEEFKIGSRERVCLLECWLKSDQMVDEPVIDPQTQLPLQNEDGSYITKSVKKYPYGRLLIVANKTLLVDMANPYTGHCQIPYVFFKARKTKRLLSWGDVEPLLRLQGKLNQLHKDAIRNLRVGMNSPWIIDRHAFDSPKKFNMLTQDPGLILPVASGARVERIPPSELPNALFGFMAYLKSIFDDVLGIQPILRGQLEKGSQLSADAVTQLQASSTARIKLKSRFLESSLQRLGHLLQWNIRQFYDSDVKIEIPKPDGNGTETIMWSDEAAHGEYTIKIEAGSSLPGAKESGANLMMTLWKNKLISRRYALNGMKLPGADKEADNMEKYEKELASLGMLAKLGKKASAGAPTQQGGM